MNAALRYADFLDRLSPSDLPIPKVNAAYGAAAELRRLHADNIELTNDLLSTQADHGNAVEALLTLMENWTATTEGGLDDETTVLMALKDHEVWPGYRIGQQWFYASGDPCAEIPTHWMDIPRHPMDTAP
ncbi:hypothetical protein HQN60_00120 [Deefgea piscis]|uniref:DUF551 domain-containing protein n=1 Tax=Deefgea piscis TaxID=2739061 RepID=A0A6M8SNZ5_9NEIS|nr:hypothetical protein [Deefgea piscis]QKJ65270.1 hypothetical protein HQN60_00120 [Deefgea piscis]